VNEKDKEMAAKQFVVVRKDSQVLRFMGNSITYDPDTQLFRVCNAEGTTIGLFCRDHIVGIYEHNMPDAEESP